MQKDLSVSDLLDVYGDMLTEKQREAIEYYYNDDLSLAEIAQNQQITRQGVRDAIKRGELYLHELENALHFVEKTVENRKKIDALRESAKAIGKISAEQYYSREINVYIKNMLDLIDTLES
mgnify:CR=1 FL=1